MHVQEKRKRADHPPLIGRPELRRSQRRCRDAFRGENLCGRCLFSPSSSPSLSTSPPSRAALHDSGSTFGGCSEYVGLCSSLGATRLASGNTGRPSPPRKDTYGSSDSEEGVYSTRLPQGMLIQHTTINKLKPRHELQSG